MRKLVEISNELNTKRKALASIFEEAGPDRDMSKVASLEGDTKAKIEKIQALNKELDALVDEQKEAQDLEQIAERNRKALDLSKAPVTTVPLPDGQPQDKKEVKPIDVAGKVAEALRTKKLQVGGKMVIPDVELKTLFQTSAGWDPEYLRTGRMVPFATRPIKVVDIIPSSPTQYDTVAYMVESTFTNNAAEATEGAAVGEGALALTETTSAVRRIGTFIPTTEEQLADVEGVQSYINNRLMFMVKQRLDLQVLTGNGTPPNLTGILSFGSLQTQAKSTDSTPDAIYKAMTKVRVTGFADPDHVVMHPNDWQAVRLLTTADGIYIWGSPADSGPERIWGLPVLQTTAETENTAIVGAFSTFCELRERKGLTVEISESHDDYFTKFKLAIRASIRVAFVGYRETAFCSVTGI